MKARASAWVVAGILALIGCGSGLDSEQSKLGADFGPPCTGEGCGDCHVVTIKSGAGAQVVCGGELNASNPGEAAGPASESGSGYERDSGAAANATSGDDGLHIEVAPYDGGVDAGPEAVADAATDDHHCNGCDGGHNEDSAVAPVEDGGVPMLADAAVDGDSHGENDATSADAAPCSDSH